LNEMPRASQTWDPEQYARDARFVAELGQPVLELLAPRPGERVLDLGCGDGFLTEKLAALGCRVIGVDASEEQVRAARARGLDARVMSGEALDFEGGFDAVFSNAALHWMKRPAAVIDGVWRALVPGGRFVGELGGVGCVARIEGALVAALERRGIEGRARSPWYFPSDAEYRGHLEAGGFRVRSIALFERPTPLPGDIGVWMETFAQPYLNAVGASERAVLLDEVRKELRPVLCDAHGVWTADYVRLRFAAEKPSR